MIQHLVSSLKFAAETMDFRKLKDFLFSLVLIYLLLPSALSDDWVLQREYSYYRTVHVNSTQIIYTPIHASTCKSEIHCAWKCLLLQSKSYYFDDQNFDCACYNMLTPHTDGHASFGESQTMFTYGRYTDVQELVKDHYVKYDIIPGRLDCLELLQDNFQQNGVYVINVNCINVDVWCDMEGGGWTVIQRRKDGSQNFYREWYHYRVGFGDRTGEYWLGLEHIHVLTLEASKLSINLTTFGDREPVTTKVEYDSFSVSNEASSFRLHTSGYSGCASDDALATSNGMGFSTLDVDNDNHPTASCAWSYHGAWWFNNCHGCHLNGLYHHNPHLTSDNIARGISWVPCYTGMYSLKGSEMKIIRKINDNTTLDLDVW